MFELVSADVPRVFLVNIARPPANAMGFDDVAELRALLERAAALPDCAALVFRASGRFFSAGADIKLMHAAGRDEASIERLVSLARVMQEAFDCLERFPAPTIAAINGIATGGGLELALACDVRIAADDARIGLTETRIGLIPGAGGTQRLTRIAGRAIASRMILAGELISATEALRLGIVHEALPQAEVAERALGLAHHFASLPRAALQAAKRCIALAPSAEGYAAEIAETERLHRDEDTRAAIAAFLHRK
ncbi:MAG: enoyl-CoA hydratase/isomerase family protein [Betaproteobacteria bacterium]|nr:enoyl-CoA hydratase/isomerase family protein [Betaproteobacteria bacterium]